ncbi:MAG: hypothetical protein IPI35_07710 [Deltaproteobacteria bacterium]|nr:hypothetical protein [Deltaproteobacteria bacterium]
MQVLVQAPRHAGDAIRMVLIRGDDGSEATLLVNDVAVTVGPVVDTLVEVGATYRRDTARSVEQNLFAVDLPADLSDARREGVIVCPLAATPDAVHALEARRVGEVLGFARSSRPYACVETHTTVDTVAYLARRIWRRPPLRCMERV